MTDRLALIGMFALASSVALGAQAPPPVGGMNGTLALEGTTNKVYRALNVVIVQTVDGVEHVLHYTKDLLVHGGRDPGADALHGLDEGSTVVVHYTATGTEETALEIDRIGDDGLEKREGIIALVDPRHKQITIRFADGRTETLELTSRAAAEAEADGASTEGAKVVVYFSSDGGRRVAHYFKKVS
jgi:hypothetical protein